MSEGFIKREVEPVPVRTLITFGDGYYGDLWRISPQPWEDELGRRWYRLQFKPEDSIVVQLKIYTATTGIAVLDKESGITLTRDYLAQHVFFSNLNPDTNRMFIACGIDGSEDTAILQRNKERDYTIKLSERKIQSLRVKIAGLLQELERERAGTKSSVEHAAEVIKTVRDATGYKQEQEKPMQEFAHA